MKQRSTFAPFKHLFPLLLVCLLPLAIAAGLSGKTALRSLNPHAADPANDDLALLDAYRHVEVASVSDALEKISGHKMYMSHRMRPIFGSKFAGFALTVQLKKNPTTIPTPWMECLLPLIKAAQTPSTSWPLKTALISLAWAD